MSAKNEDDVPSIKIVVLGEVSTGAKTSLLRRFVADEFTEFQNATIAVSFMTKQFEVDGTTVKLEMWGLHKMSHREERDVEGRSVVQTIMCTHGNRHSRAGAVPLAGADVLPGCSCSDSGL